LCFLLDLGNPMLIGKLLELVPNDKSQAEASREFLRFAAKSRTRYKIAARHACIGMHDTPELLQHRPAHVALLMLALNNDAISPGCADSLGPNIAWPR